MQKEKHIAAKAADNFRKRKNCGMARHETRHKTRRLAFRDGTFRNAKQAVSDSETACFSLKRNASHMLSNRQGNHSLASRP